MKSQPPRFADRPLDPALDLVLTRVVDVPRSVVWSAWTVPDQLMQWFTPAPWRTVECEIDLVPGGAFRTVFRSPEGETFPSVGCYLEVLAQERLTWTNVLGPGFRPAGKVIAGAGEPLGFTATITLEDAGGGTRYTARVIHGNPADRARHAEMGFNDGWSKALDQLVEFARRR